MDEAQQFIPSSSATESMCLRRPAAIARRDQRAVELAVLLAIFTLDVPGFGSVLRNQREPWLIFRAANPRRDLALTPLACRSLSSTHS
jgi:hypothetical protein